MNLFQMIKALFATKNAAEKIKEAYKMDTTTIKPGWKTTEFWITAITVAVNLWGSVKGFIPADKATIITALAVPAYALARAIVKLKGVDLPDVAVPQK